MSNEGLKILCAQDASSRWTLPRRSALREEEEEDLHWHAHSLLIITAVTAADADWHTRSLMKDDADKVAYRWRQWAPRAAAAAVLCLVALLVWRLGVPSRDSLVSATASPLAHLSTISARTLSKGAAFFARHAAATSLAQTDGDNNDVVFEVDVKAAQAKAFRGTHVHHSSVRQQSVDIYHQPTQGVRGCTPCSTGICCILIVQRPLAPLRAVHAVCQSNTAAHPARGGLASRDARALGARLLARGLVGACDWRRKWAHGAGAAQVPESGRGAPGRT